MSISSSLSIALSGLRSSQREVEVISNNVANALTPGYSRRSVEVSSLVTAGRGDGVRVAGIRLAQDPATVAARRISDADLASQETTLSNVARLADRIGLPDDAGSLAGRLSTFENALLAATNDPVSETNLSNILYSAKQVAVTFEDLAAEVQRIRTEADSAIAAQVTTLNASLASIENLNEEIRIRTFSEQDASALIDERKRFIDQISDIIPIRTVPRENGAVAIFSQRGTVLIDGPALSFGFTPTPTVTQAQTIGGGALSGLTLGGVPWDVGMPNDAGYLDGGSLSALFRMRDTVMPGYADQLDAMASEVIRRFQDPAVDPSLTATDAGLFTDAGGFYDDATNREGIASRIAVSTLPDPDFGGDLTRLRNGLLAGTPLPVGDNSVLSAMRDAAVDPRVPAPVLGTVMANGLSGLAGQFTANLNTTVNVAEDERAYLSTINTALRETESATTGVNTDAEMQRLLLVEQAYAANARVITVVDDLIRRLLEI